jgi:hypothetical protein
MSKIIRSAIIALALFGGASAAFAQPEKALDEFGANPIEFFEELGRAAG